MKMKNLLITLVSVIIVFFIISLVQERITWPLLQVLIIMGFIINLCMSLLSEKKKIQ
jgi:xanthosine utilization system XapX-like protein